MYKIPARTVFIGKNLIYVPECHSTNDLAAVSGASKAVPEGTVVITDHQTAGRGQHGNSWLTEPCKNLTLSIVLKPGFLLPRDQFNLNIAISLAVYDFLSLNLDVPSFIKWPNDLIVRDKKITGILIENQVMGSRIVQSVVGIGINVNQQRFPIPAATSMSLVADNKIFLLPDLLETLLEQIEFRFVQLRSGRITQMKEEYLRHLYWFGEERYFESQGERFEGIITGIDVAGRLQLKSGDATRTFQVKELTFVG